MKTVFKKSIALALLTSTLASQIFGASEVTATPAVEITQADKTKLQKAANISGAFLRGAARGAASGIPTGFAKSVLDVDNNFDQLFALLFDNGQVRTLSEAIAGTIDDTDASTLTEEITAAFVHATLVFGIGIHKKNHSIKKDLLNFFTVFTNRLVKGLDTRKAEGVRKYALLAAIGITESINFKELSKCDSVNYFFRRVFRPLVGVTAIGRTVLVDKIINAREASGKCTNAQEIKRTRTVLNGTLGFAMSLAANIVNLKLNDLIMPKPQSTFGNQGFGGQRHDLRSGATNPLFRYDERRARFSAAQEIEGNWCKLGAGGRNSGADFLQWDQSTRTWDEYTWI